LYFEVFFYGIKFSVTHVPSPHLGRELSSIFQKFFELQQQTGAGRTSSSDFKKQAVLTTFFTVK
jgi:hypothetical protein